MKSFLNVSFVAGGAYLGLRVAMFHARIPWGTSGLPENPGSVLWVVPGLMLGAGLGWLLTAIINR